MSAKTGNKPTSYLVLDFNNFNGPEICSKQQLDDYLSDYTDTNAAIEDSELIIVNLDTRKLVTGAVVTTYKLLY